MEHTVFSVTTCSVVAPYSADGILCVPENTGQNYIEMAKAGNILLSTLIVYNLGRILIFYSLFYFILFPGVFHFEGFTTAVLGIVHTFE